MFPSRYKRQEPKRTAARCQEKPLVVEKYRLAQMREGEKKSEGVGGRGVHNHCLVPTQRHCRCSSKCKKQKQKRVGSNDEVSQ